MTRHVTRALKSLAKLGLANGCAVYFYYIYHRLFPSLKWTPRLIRVRGIPRPVWLRPGLSDWILMERVFLDREYDPLSRPHDDAMDRLHAAIVAGGRRPLIVDCGANIGLSAIWLSERFPEAIVLAVEPEPANFVLLERNAGNFPNIKPILAAVSDRTASVSLVNASGTPWAWQVAETQPGGTPTVTLPDILTRHPNGELFIVKIDIEGFETNLFRSRTEWVDRVPLMIFEPHDWMTPWSGSANSFIQVLCRNPRDYLTCGENIFAYSHSLVGPNVPDRPDVASAGQGLAPVLLANTPNHGGISVIEGKN